MRFNANLIFCICILFSLPLKSQKVNIQLVKVTKLLMYQTSLDTLSFILKNNFQFKEAVTIVENTYYDSIRVNNYNTVQIASISRLIKKYFASNDLNKYYVIDSINYKINASIKSFITDSIKFQLDDTILSVPPFRFNHNDPLGKKDITNTFVTKLLQTHQGNCRSLTYLYKILADELGAKCWIALAPGHMYIKNYSQKIGWYNTELTSGSFPTDAYIMASSYIHPKAVKSGMYMDTLSNQQAIALCVLDLAHLYERQTKNYYDGFILKCCNLVLEYHPVNPMALLLKAETLKKQLIWEKVNKYPKLTYTQQEMEATYIRLFELGYREMPKKMKAQRQQAEKQRAEKAKR